MFINLPPFVIHPHNTRQQRRGKVSVEARARSDVREITTCHPQTFRRSQARNPRAPAYSSALYEGGQGRCQTTSDATQRSATCGRSVDAQLTLILARLRQSSSGSRDWLAGWS